VYSSAQWRVARSLSARLMEPAGTAAIIEKWLNLEPLAET
jgi:hypothetical protein